MCSMVDYEMFLPHSPSMFSHSPPTGFLSDFATLSLGHNTFPRGTCRQNSFAAAYDPVCTSVTSPKRPCLVIRPADDTPMARDEDPMSPTRLKKKVVFADDKGRPLTHVRVMTEPSNVPPLWSMKFLAEVTGGINAEPEAEAEPWEVTFPQPASDYVAFRNKLESNRVCLENVIIKEADDQIIGTIKVSNISFHKEVIVRHTSNNWKTYEDTFCTFIPNNIIPGTTYVLYDTFSFKINLRPKARRLEFCVLFKCDGKEYWDSNNGRNYVIIKKALTPLYRSLSDDNLQCKRNKEQTSVRSKCADISQAKLDSWSEFASWNHLENSAPYW